MCLCSVLPIFLTIGSGGENDHAQVLKLCHTANKAHKIATRIYGREEVFVVLFLVAAEKKGVVKSI